MASQYPIYPCNGLRISSKLQRKQLYRLNTIFTYDHQFIQIIAIMFLYADRKWCNDSVWKLYVHTNDNQKWCSECRWANTTIELWRRPEQREWPWVDGGDSFFTRSVDTLWVETIQNRRNEWVLTTEPFARLLDHSHASRALSHDRFSHSSVCAALHASLER